jgi:hypothetical protein
MDWLLQHVDWAISLFEVIIAIPVKKEVIIAIRTTFIQVKPLFLFLNTRIDIILFSLQ